MVLMPREYALAEIDLAAILIERGQHERAQALLTDAWTFVERSPPTGIFGSGVMAASIHALRGEPERAITALRTAIECRLDRELVVGVAVRPEPGVAAQDAGIPSDRRQHGSQDGSRARTSRDA